MDIELNKAARKRFFLFYIILSLIFLLYCWHVSMAYDLYPDKDATIPVLSAITKGAELITSQPLELYITPSTKVGILYGVLIPFVLGIAIFGNPKNTMFGKEHGSSRWGLKREKRALADKDDNKNMIFTNDVKLSMNTRKTRLNNNILAAGGSGSGKSRFFGIPNIAQANCSYVITDPKGELIQKTAKLLEEKGYRIICFNLREKEHSCCYNPFHYIHKEEDIFKLVKQIIKTTKPKDAGAGTDPFWEDAETLFLQCCFFYTWLECPIEEQNMKTVMLLLNCASASEEDENQQSELDILFEKLKEKRGSNHIAYKQYNLFKKAAGKTTKSILISAGSRLSPFNLKEVEDLFLTDTLHLNEIGDRKTALYIVLSDSDSSFNFIISMLYTQLFDELYFQADFGEMKWENNKILYKSKESLYSQKVKLLDTYKEAKETEGNIRKRELRVEIIEILKSIEKEFGLPYPSFDEIMPQKIMDKYLIDLESCYLRLNNKTATLKRYYRELKDLYKMLLFLKDSSFKGLEVRNIKSKIDTYTLRIEYEFGIKREKRRTSSLKEYLKDTKIYLLEVKKLLKELIVSENKYGTRQSFDDKCKKIEILEEKIKENEKLLKQASFFQRELKTKYKKNIQNIKKEIKRVETLVEYEFGIIDVKKRKNSGRLQTHVRCILDEFPNIPPPPDFEKLLATMRSREMSATIIIQNIAQIKSMFKEAWETIVGNCDSFLFLGGQEESTLEMVNKRLGKMTLDKRTTGVTKSQQGSSSENWDNMGRDLLFTDEIQKVDTKYCILFIRGKPPFLSQKFHLEEHKNYGMIGDDGNPVWMFDYKKAFITANTMKAMVRKQFFDEEVKKIIKQRVQRIGNQLKKQQMKLSNNFEKGNIRLLKGNELKEVRERREILTKKVMLQLEDLLENPTFKIEKVNSDVVRALISEKVLSEDEEMVLGEPLIEDEEEQIYDFA